MKAPSSSWNTIEDFLACKRLAMVGVSRNPKDFSAGLFRELCERGYDVVPVNPLAEEVEGRRCFSHMQDIQPQVEAALLMTPPAVTEAVAKDCVEAGIRRLWMYRAGGPGSVSAKAVEVCKQSGVDVVAGECPYMFLPGTKGVHRWHGWLRKILGSYPR